MVNNIKKIYTSYFDWHLFLTVSEQSSECWEFSPTSDHRFSKRKIYSIENLLC